MKKTIKLLLATASIVGLAALSAQAATVPPPSGSLTNLIVGSTNVLWDFSLLTNQLQNLDLNLHRVSRGATDTVEVVYADTFTQDGHGKLAGSGSNDVTLIRGGAETNSFSAKYSTLGSVTGAKGVSHLTFMSKTSGKVVLTGETKETPVTAMATYVVKFDANSNSVTEHSIEEARVGSEVYSKTKPIGPISISDLASELGDGTWTLVLNFGTATGDKLTGIASVTLSSGQVYSFDFTGEYAPHTQKSKLNLKGTDAAKGSSLEITLEGNDIIRITGQVAGQSVNIK